MIRDEGGFTWAECDNCTFTMGVGFRADKSDCVGALKRWGWSNNNGRILCDSCTKDPTWVNKYRSSERRGA